MKPLLIHLGKRIYSELHENWTMKKASNWELRSTDGEREWERESLLPADDLDTKSILKHSISDDEIQA